MPNILAFSGRKGSGKNTAFNSMLGFEMIRLGIVRSSGYLTNTGKLFINDMFGDKEYAGIFDVDRRTDVMIQFLDESIYPYIKNYSFADNLKRKVCIDVLGLSHEQCFGSDDQKNSLTHLKWEDMPGVITQKPPAVFETITGRLGYYYSTGEYKTEDGFSIPLVYHAPGPMTAREVMQFVGTDIFRKMYHNVWAESTIRTITKENSEMAVITDCRFPNEVDVVQKAGGRVIRLTRAIDSSDQHPSESALDKDKFDWQRFDAVIDNAKMSIPEQSDAIHEQLVEWGFRSKL